MFLYSEEQKMNRCRYILSTALITEVQNNAFNGRASSDCEAGTSAKLLHNAIFLWSLDIEIGEHVGKLSRVEMDILITLAIQPYCSKNGIKIMHQGHTVTHSSGKHPLLLKGKNRWNCHYKSVCLATSYRYNYFLSEFSLMDPKSTKSLWNTHIPD